MLKQVLPTPTPYTYSLHILHHLNVCAADPRRTGGGAASQDLAVLLDIDDGGAGDTDRAGSVSSGGTGEGDGAEVGESDLGAALVEVLNDPLSIGLAKGAQGSLVGEGVLDGLAGGHVLNGSNTASLAGCSDGNGDLVTSGKADATEVVCVVRVPLIPSIICDGRARLGPVNAGLEDGGLASVAVNANPGGARASAGWGGDSERSGDALVASSNEDGTSPVGAVLGVGDVGAGTINAVDWISLAAAGSTLAVTLSTAGSAWGGNGRAGEEESTGDGGELHICRW